MANAEVGSAYLSIIPSIKNINSKIFDGIKSAAKGVVAGIGAIGAAAVSAGGVALKNFGAFEQMAGGTKAIFQDAASAVQGNAVAAQGLGISMTDYMSQLNSFGSALKQSLGGDVQKAASIGDMAIKDMADNVSVFGTNIQDVQNAYQGFAKQNYTMLDNLKLGYGGTKTEMQRLISDANSLRVANGQAGDLTIDKFSDVVEAIHTVQENMGVTGNASREMATTIEGSIAGVKAAFSNWLAALGDSNADIGAFTKALVDSIANALKVIIPRMAIIIGALISELPTLFSSLTGTLAPIFINALSNAWNTAAEFVANTFNISVPNIDSSGIINAFNSIKDTVSQVIAFIAPYVAGAFRGIGTALSFVAANLNSIIPIIGIAVSALGTLSVISKVSTAIKSAATAFNSFNTALSMIKSFQGLGAVLSTLAGGSVVIVIASIAALGAAFVLLYNNSETFRNAVQTAWTNIQTLAAAVWPSIELVISTVMTSIQTVIQTAWPIIQTVITTVMNAIQMVVQTIWPFISTAFQMAGDTISQIVAVVWPIIQSIITGVMNTIMTIVNTVWPVVTSAFNLAFTVISGLVQTVWPLIQGIITGVMQAIQGIIQGVWPIVMAIFRTAGSVIKGVIDTVFPAIQAIISGVMSAIQTIINVVMNLVQGNWSGAWNAISSFLSGALDGIKSAVQSGLNNVASFFSDLPGNILGALGDVGNLLVNAGKSIIDGLLNGLKNAIGGVYDFVSGIAGKITSLKGPIPYDLKLLIPNGQAIMHGLQEGISVGLDKVLEDVVEIAPAIKSEIDTSFNTPDFSSGSKYMFEVESSPAQSGYDLIIAWLEKNLPQIISTYTPMPTDREWKRAISSI